MFPLSLVRRASHLKTAHPLKRRLTMATAYKINVDVQDTGLWKVKQTEEAAKKTSELLQHDLEASSLPSIMDSQCCHPD